MPPPVTPPPFAPPELASRELSARFLQAWQALDCPPVWRRILLAVSGGPDSLALLHLLHETRHAHRLELVVAHADHEIQDGSGAVAQRVVQAAAVLGLPVVVGRLALGPGTSETRAREARHDWLELMRRTHEADAVAFAHHEDDQVETILLRVLAGSGPAGLAGMLPRQAARVRPLLSFSRAELAAWLEARGIASWDDPANLDPAHERSWLRATVLPLLAEREPAVGARLLRLGRQAASDRRAWGAALDALPGLNVQQGPGRISVAALPLAAYDSALAVALLQALARRAGCVLGERRAGRVLDLLRRGQSGRAAELGAGWCAEVSFGRLCFYRPRAVPPALALTGERGHARWGCWQVSWSREPAPARMRRDGWVAWFIGKGAVLRGLEARDRLAPLGGSGRRAVGRLLQDVRVERSRRAGWLLVEVEGNLVWVAGVCRGGDAMPSEGEDALRIEVSGG